MTAFEQIYRKVAVNANYLQPSYPRMDNWAVDRWEMAANNEDRGLFFAGMTDGGYCRYIGYAERGHVVWRIDEAYGPKGTVYTFRNITQETLDAIDVSNLPKYSS